MIRSPCTGNAAASVFAAFITGVMFYVPYSWAMPAVAATAAGPRNPNILYITLGDPATTLCGIWDGVDANGSTVSGIIYCNGDHVPPDDPRFPRAHRGRSWI